MPLSFFKIGNIAAANAVQMPVVASMFSMFFFLSIYVQSILHYSPLATGLAFLPVSLIIGTVATQAPRLIRRFGYKPLLIVAPLFLAAGLFIFTFTGVDSTYWHILPGLLIMPIGLGLSFVSVTIAATAGVPGRESGLASGLINTSQQIGGSIGLAILSGIAASATAAAAATHTTTMSMAEVAGFHSAFYAGMVFALIASCIAFVFIKPIQPTDTPATSMH
jgi:predicted MFS family arabinose efflux permease